MVLSFILIQNRQYAYTTNAREGNVADQACTGGKQDWPSGMRRTV